MVAFRYLRARRQEGFVSVIAIFSLLGIALGVATLIIVMSVMNGFRADLLGRILGLNGHLGVYAQTGSLGDFDAEAAKVTQVPGVTGVTPLIEGQVMATSEIGAAGALVMGATLADGAQDVKSQPQPPVDVEPAQRIRLRPSGIEDREHMRHTFCAMALELFNPANR